MAEIVNLGSGEIVPLVPETDEDTIRELEWLLDQARKGHVVGFAFVSVNARGEITSGYHGRIINDMPRFIGATAILHSRALEGRGRQIVPEGSDID